MPPLVSGSGREHRFRVFLPPGYHENTLKKYPVLYMHDGQNLFFREEAFVGNSWMTDNVLTVLDKMNAIEEVIVVGIYPNERMSEYTLPGYEDYCRFLVETLKPLIDARYRTLAGATDTAVMGSSLGGVVSFYLGWQRPDVFGKSRAFRARLRTGTICSSASLPSRRGNSGFISIAAGQPTTTNPHAA
jgi:predicted alpha/beta superfamily hydrolase